MAEQNRQCSQRTPRHREPALPPVDYFYLPAMPPLELGQAVGRWFRAWRQRRARRELERLGEHLQEDIGARPERPGRRRL